MVKANSLSIRQRDGVREFERHMAAVQRGDRILKVPRVLAGAGSLGRAVSFAQLVATWANSSSQRLVRTTLSAGSHDDLMSFVSRLPGLSVTYFSDRVESADGIDVRESLARAAGPRLRAMANRDYALTAKGRLAELVFLTRARLQFHSAVYRRAPDLKERKDPELHGKLIVDAEEMNAFIVNVLHALRVVRRDMGRLRPLLHGDDIPLGRLLHETFKNTAEHAYIAGDTEGLRCILIAPWRLHYKELQPAAFVSGDHPKTDEYFARLRNRRARASRALVFVLEFSVFDTGPGFARTIQRAKQCEDVDAVRQCFLKGVSSKPGPNSGLGLSRVLDLVWHLDGFVRIRTSTAEAFYSALTPDQGSERTPHIVGDLPQTTGTALTIGVPLAF